MTIKGREGQNIARAIKEAILQQSTTPPLIKTLAIQPATYMGQSSIFHLKVNK